MFFRELNRGKCKTCLLACERTGRAVIVDPLREHVSNLKGGMLDWNERGFPVER